MVPSYAAFSSAPGVVYYQSFAGYGIPLKPQGAIPFERTERLASYNLVRHEGDGRVQWFAKILAEEQAAQPWRSAEAHAPGALLFFEVGVRSESFDIGPPIDYRATEHRDSYVEVEVGPGGVDGQAVLLRREVFFADLYTYGPGGRLRGRKMVSTAGGFTVWRYDDRGKIVAKENESGGGFSASELRLMGIPAGLPVRRLSG